MTSEANPIGAIFRALKHLPPDKVLEVRDYVLFLQQRYGYSKEPEYSDTWSEEDIQDLSAYVADYADQVAPWDGPLPGYPGEGAEGRPARGIREPE